jgi:hypothetical protein
MDDLERRLCHALIAYVGGNRPAMPCARLAEALRARLGCDAFSIHPYNPEDFLIVLASEELKRRLLSGLPLFCQGSQLFFRPWTRLAQATKVMLRSQAHLVLEGILPHAWDREVAEDLVGTACSIDAIAPDSASRSNLTLFKMTVWTDDPDNIPLARTLVIPEPDQELEDDDHR